MSSHSQLNLLLRDIGARQFCHSAVHRGECHHSLPVQDGLAGINGSPLGWCQALISSDGDAEKHTEHFTRILQEAGAMLPNSHEVFYGYRLDDVLPQDYVNKACRPLVSQNGRVPIVITALDPLTHGEEIEKILVNPPPIKVGETMAIRLVLGSKGSFSAAGKLLRRLVEEAKKAKIVPWWPLFQASADIDSWRSLRNDLGSLWKKYATVAINPFTSSEFLDEFSSQVCVGQIPIGLAGDISINGAIRLSPGLSISGASSGAGYDLFEWSKMLADREINPTLIVLGPALPMWTEQQNIERIRKIDLLLPKVLRLIHRHVPERILREVTSLAA